MTTELVLLGTAGAPMPVAGRAGISSALVVDGRVLVIDCGRGAPSAFAEAGLDFSRLEAVFLTPALAYRFDTPDGSASFSGDTTVKEGLIALARGADLLVHQVADLGYLKRHGTDDAELARMAALHTDVTQIGGVAERAQVRELILNHYLPADPAAITEAEWAQRAGHGFSGITTAGCDGLRRTLLRQQDGHEGSSRGCPTRPAAARHAGRVGS